MSGERRGQKDLTTNLFPFLDVFVCTMGALVLILVLCVRQAQLTVEDFASVTEVTQVSEEITALQSELQGVRERQQADLDRQRSELAHLEDHIARLLKRMEELAITAKEIESKRDLTDEQKLQLEKEVTELRDAIAKEEAEVKKKLEEAEKDSDKPAFSIIPYVGPNGTSRRPIYLECTAEGVVVQPEGFLIEARDLRPPYGPGNPLDAVLRTVRSHLEKLHPDEKQAPYPLLIVRPSGIRSYAMARSAMNSWDDQFGYELVDEQMPLKFPPQEEVLRNELQRTLALARERQTALIAAMPGRLMEYAEDEAEWQHGDEENVPDQEFASAGEGGEGFGLPGQNGSGSGGIGGTGMAGVASSAAPNGQGFGATNGGAGGMGYGNTGLPGGAFGTGSGAYFAGAGGSGSPGGSGPISGSALPGDSTNGTGPSTAMIAGTGVGGTNSTFGNAGDGASGMGNPSGNPNAVGSGTGLGGTQAKSGAGTGASAGQPGAMAPSQGGATTAGGELGSNPDGYAGEPGLQGDASSGTTQPGTAGKVAGNPRDQGSAGGSGTDSNVEGGSASGSSSGNQLAQDGVASGPAPPPDSVYADQRASGGAGGMGVGGGEASPGVTLGPQKTKASKSAKDQIAEEEAARKKKRGRERPPTNGIVVTRGMDWTQQNMSGTAIERTIRVACLPDRWIVMPESQSQPMKTIFLRRGLTQARTDLSKIIGSRVDSWGIAIAGGYWKPRLVVEVMPGADQQFEDLQRVLKGSGMDAVKDENPPAQK